ncbi:unnamed protein product [Mesocestoides corti]|uniref:Uncharacterized protein n=1 Tax=Mesocestoides corti TaxID=53468 RepID=A0A0R3UIP4_MESCO|nr:unnamed protein product [Mesocestoides corti]
MVLVENPDPKDRQARGPHLPLGITFRICSTPPVNIAHYAVLAGLPKSNAFQEKQFWSSTQIDKIAQLW